MEQYYFLFGLALAYLIFAVIQDMRTREIANWLNFSLIVFALAYRAFYSSYSGDWMFFAYGVIGVLIFTLLGYAFYYSGIFAGGDARRTPIKQAVISAADGAIAALSAEQHVNKRAKLRPQYS